MVWETTSTPFGTTQAVSLHPWPISNHSQILPSGASSPYSLMVNGTPSYAQVPGYELSSPSHAAVLCIPWLKLFNYTTWFSEWRANFTWNESYCEKNQSRTLKPFFFLYTTPPFILITTFCGIQYPFKYTKREMFLAVSLQEPGRLSQELILHVCTTHSSSSKGSYQRIGQACTDQIAPEVPHRGLPFLSHQSDNACE